MTTHSVQKWIDTAASSAHESGARHGVRLRNPRALQKWLYVLAAALGAVWTLMMWGAYALLGFSDEALSAAGRFFTIDAQVLGWLSAFVGGAEQLGAAVVLIVWMIGVALLLLGTWLGRRLIGAFSQTSMSAGARAF